MLAYIAKPRWARVCQRLLFLGRYLMLAGAGVLAVYQEGNALHLVGWTLVCGSFLAMVGVFTGRFHLELVPIWFIIAALVLAAGVLFGSERYTSGILVLALVPALAERLLHLSLVASRARSMPALSAVEVVTDGDN